jgi:peptidoglycan hydrolase CwlO-like protein
MMRIIAVTLLLVASATATTYSETLRGKAGVSPVAKVTQMLNDMLTKSKEEKQDEEVRFAAFKQFCAGSAAEKTRSIEAADSAIGKIAGEIDDLKLEVDQLGADIQKADSDVAQLSKKIGALAEEITNFDNEMEADKEERDSEHAEFEKKDGDYATSIDSLDRAITEVKNSEPGAAAAMLQVASLKMVSGEAKRKIYSFLEQDPNDQTPEQLLQKAAQPAGEAAAYEGQTDGIVDMFKKLDEKFEDEREGGQKEEMNKKHAYDVLMQELTNLLDKAKDEKESKTALKAKREQDLASAEGELAETRAQKAEDEKYLKELNAECEQKSADFENRQEMRAGEIAAVSKAVEILSGDAVAGSSAKHLELAQDGSSFAQLRASGRSNIQNRVAVFLQDKASSSGSRILSMVAARCADDPFTKVKKMIKDMITRLMEEANEEAEHKGWCDTELGTNQQTRDSKSADAESLKAEIEEMTATSAKLSEDITELSNGVATIDAAVADQTATREEEKAKNEEAIADAKAAQTAVAQAISVLKEFYAKAGDATSFEQIARRGPAEDAPETFSTPFKGSQDSASGVLGMLEVVQSDFARLETETTAGEEEASRAYQSFMGDSSEQKAVKSAGIKHKTNKKQETESALAEAKRDLEGTQEELDAALAYYEKLKPSCVDSGVSYEERVARRKEEIESLQEALKILSGDDIAV